MGNAILLILGVGAFVLIGSNYKRCMGGSLPAGTFCADGTMLPVTGNATGTGPAPAFGTCQPATSAQLFNCLTSFTGGYQGGF